MYLYLALKNKEFLPTKPYDHVLVAIVGLQK